MASVFRLYVFRSHATLCAHFIIHSLFVATCNGKGIYICYVVDRNDAYNRVKDTLYVGRFSSHNGFYIGVFCLAQRK